MTQYDNTNTWALFANNKRREGKNDPTHTGSANVEGREFYLDAWVHEKDGKRYFSGKMKPKNAKPDAVPMSMQVRRPSADMDDEIPF